MNCIIEKILVLSLVCLTTDLLSQSFTQKVDYKIYAKLDEINNVLHGNETIIYFNNSDDTLSYLYLHLYPNALSSTKTQYAQTDKFVGNGNFCFVTEKNKSYIDSLNFSCNGKSLSLYLDKENPDIAKLHLQEPLIPHTSVELKTTFRTKIPFPYAGFGVKNEVYNIAHWYPKIAVYDKNKWHTIPFTKPTNTYSDIGRYEVELNVPAAFVIASSGKLSYKNIDEKKQIETLIAESKSIIKGQIDSCSFCKRNGRKIISFIQDSIQDFAWTASKNYLIDEKTIKLPTSEKTITIKCFFTKHDCNTALKIHEKIVEDIILNSKKYFDFPFDELKIIVNHDFNKVNNYYPCILFINTEKSDTIFNFSEAFFRTIIATNYDEYSWLQNSILTYADNKYFTINKKARYLNILSKKTDSYQLWAMYATKGIRKENLVNGKMKFVPENAYSTALFTYLEEYIGKEKYEKGIRDFFEKFAFAHPYPNDLKITLEKISNKNLDWIFDTLLQNNKLPDLVFSKYDRKDNSINIENVTKSPLSANVSFFRNDSLKETLFTPVFCDEYKLNIPSDIDYIVLNSKKNLFEKRFDNNRFDIKRKRNLLRVDIYKFKDNVDKRNIHLYPFAFWTQTEGFMPILYITNQITQSKFVNFQLAPMYSLKHNNFVGEAKISANKYTLSGAIRLIQPFVSYRTYYFPSGESHNYKFNRFESGLNFIFRNNNINQNAVHKLTLKYHLSEQDYQKYVLQNGAYVEDKKVNTLRAFRVQWLYDDRKQINPRKNTAFLDFSDDFARLQTKIDGKIHYNSPKRYFSYTLYAGSYLFKKNEFIDKFDGRIGISGISSKQDIFLDHWFMGRNSKDMFFQQQTYLDFGSFYANIINGKTWDWAASITLKSTFPIDLPLQIYGSIGIFPDQITNKLGWAWETGINLSIIPDFIEIAFPLIIDKNSREITNLNYAKYINRIRFIINFDKLNIHKCLEHPSIPIEW